MYKMGLIRIMQQLKLAIHQPGDKFEVGGKKTSYGFNTSSTLLCGDTAALVFSLLMKQLMKLQPTVVAGCGEGAMLMVANAAVWYQRCRGVVFDATGLTFNPEPIACRVPRQPGKQAVVLADVITSGKLIKPVVMELIDTGHTVLAVIPLLDRRKELGLNELEEFDDLVKPLLVTADFEDMDPIAHQE